MLETLRLVLREFTPADAPFILRLLNEPSFIENIADRGVRTAEQAETYLLEGPIRSCRERGHGLWAVRPKGQAAPIGMCGLIKRDAFVEVDLGYAFLPEAWGQGYAGEAAAGCLAFARERMGLARVIAIVTPGNRPSIKVLERLGFAPAGTTVMPPDPAELALYAIRLDLPAAERGAESP